MYSETTPPEKAEPAKCHVMVDLETLGTVPGCIVLSIGAVYFDRTGLGREFYTVVKRQTCTRAGLFADADTLAWWQRQPEAAKAVLKQAAKGGAGVLALPAALRAFNAFLVCPGGAKVWGNGADFDNPILRVAYDKTGIVPGWAPFNGRCYRTLKNGLHGPKLTRVGTHHNALDDAKSQALHLIELLKANPSVALA
jgi:hypothetical protein